MRGRTETSNAAEGSQNVQQAGGDIHGIPPETHREMMKEARDEVRADLEAKFAEARRADAAEAKALRLEIEVLQGKLAEYERRVANPEAAYAEFKRRIAELEDLLKREGNELGAARLEEAIKALEGGDYSVADGIFAEIKAREQLAVERSARASFGRGEIAEAEIRWADAAEHYAEAARLVPSFKHLRQDWDLAWKLGDYARAEMLGAQLEAAAIKEFGQGSHEHGTSLSCRALILNATGQFDQAEPLYREALEIARKTLGEEHPDYATRLNNLAGLLRATGRYEEAEPLYREALEIGRKTLGEGHPQTAGSLNNLAVLLRDTGRYEEAEPLYREALEITRTALGEGHPDYATRLNNLALLLRGYGSLRGGGAALPGGAGDRPDGAWGGASGLCHAPQQPRLVASGYGSLRGGGAALPGGAGDPPDGARGGASGLCDRASTTSLVLQAIRSVRGGGAADGASAGDL